MKVGDMVRFNSNIIEANGHIALSRDKGIVVSMDERGRIATVRWNDGHMGEYRVKTLARTVGTLGQAVFSEGELRNGAVKDRGHAPIKPPTRTIPIPLPVNAPSDRYTVKPILLEWYVPSKVDFDKNGNPVSIPMRLHKVRVRCERTGLSWVFTGRKVNKQWKYTDSRVKANGLKDASLPIPAFYAEMARYTDNAASMWDGAPKMGPAEYKETYGV